MQAKLDLRVCMKWMIASSGSIIADVMPLGITQQKSKSSMRDKPHPFQWAVDNPPIGIWDTAAGSFDVVMQSRFSFFPDGSGEVAVGNAFGFDLPHRFEWTHPSPGELKIFLIDPKISFAENADEKLDEMNWEKIMYTTDIVETDVGVIPVLRDVNASFPDAFPISFWDTHNPITLVSRLSERSE